MDYMRLLTTKKLWGIRLLFPVFVILLIAGCSPGIDPNKDNNDPPEVVDPGHPSTNYWKEDFNDINLINDSKYLSFGTPWLGNVQQDVSIVTKSGEKALYVNSYSTDTTGQDPFTNKIHVFSTKEKTPANFKLEFRFMYGGNTGGWPHITAVLADPAPHVYDYLNKPVFSYRHPLGTGWESHYIRVDRNDGASGSTAMKYLEPYSENKFPPNTWHTVEVTVFDGTYGLTLNDEYIGSIRLDPAPAAGYITFRVQALEAWFDYIKISENTSGGADYNPGSISVLPEAPGNIYPNTEQLSFTLDFKNNADFLQTIQDCTFEVKDNKGTTVQTGAVAPFTVQANGKGKSSPIPLTVTGNGNFNITVLANGTTPWVVTQFTRVFPTPDWKRSPFSTSIHFSIDYANVDVDPPLVALGGWSFTRDDIFWENVETSRGIYIVPQKWGKIIETTIANGIEPLIVLGFGNSRYDGGGIPYTQEALEAWDRYVRAVANHSYFKGKVKYYQVWNEMNVEHFNITNRGPADYTALLKRTYNILKEIDPEIFVVCGSVAFMYNNNMDEWITGIMDAGGYGYMDAFAYHPYSIPNSFEYAGRAVDLTNIYNTINDVKYRGSGNFVNIWATEYGWPTNSVDHYGVTEEVSAAYTVRAQTQMLSLGFIDRMNLYQFQNKGNDKVFNGEHNFGAVRHSYDPELPWGAKQSFVAQNAMSTFLCKATYQSSNVSGNNYVYRFSRPDGKTVVVAWHTNASWNESSDTSSEASITVSGSYTVYDMYGNAIQTGSGSTANVTLSRFPVYIVY